MPTRMAVATNERAPSENMRYSASGVYILRLFDYKRREKTPGVVVLTVNSNGGHLSSCDYILITAIIGGLSWTAPSTRAVSRRDRSRTGSVAPCGNFNRWIREPGDRQSRVSAPSLTLLPLNTCYGRSFTKLDQNEHRRSGQDGVLPEKNGSVKPQNSSLVEGAVTRTDDESDAQFEGVVLVASG
jgi:hypothetical protein